MLALQSEEERIVGVLHDVVEDCPDWSPERLQQEGFSRGVLDALRAVTKEPHEHGDANYMAFIDRAGQHPVGRAVKIADLTDNMDLSRMENPTEADQRRVERYRAARDRLLHGVHRTSTP
jgi:(p)ppGpp synthase/HD superfamily hydrolase